jgi:redox-sensitive bicupin YhaK (pirin superfamily)
MNRRFFLKIFIFFPGVARANWFKKLFSTSKDSMIKEISSIDFQWPVQKPFLFCVHHLDHYPRGNKNLGIDSAHFNGRMMGQDFQLKDGFRLYHGEEIPGFPVHPHRGFETITIVRKGYVDHADSLGAAGRYGEGDVQWMTAGSGVQHSEMFPLLRQDQDNTVELFQIWLNLPKKNKMVTPDFKMLWGHEIPKVTLPSGGEISVISGVFEGVSFFEAPANSWAKDPENKVNIYLVKLNKDESMRIPAQLKEVNRSLYFFEGKEIKINNDVISQKKAIFLEAESDVLISAPSGKIEFLYLEAVAINEPVVQHGPFVMNSREEIFQTFEEYQKTEFGGWPWPRRDMIHGNKLERFAKYPNGKVIKPNEGQK